MPEALVKPIKDAGSYVNKKRKDVTSDLANATKNVIDYTITNPVKQAGTGSREERIGCAQDGRDDSCSGHQQQRHSLHLRQKALHAVH